MKAKTRAEIVWDVIEQMFRDLPAQYRHYRGEKYLREQFEGVLRDDADSRDIRPIARWRPPRAAAQQCTRTPKGNHHAT
jgi:hypothetical protein